MKKEFKLFKKTGRDIWNDIDLTEIEGNLVYVSDVFMSEDDGKSLVNSIYDVWPRENGGWMKVPKINLEPSEAVVAIKFDGKLAGFVQEVMPSDFKEPQTFKAGRFQITTRAIKGTYRANDRFSEILESWVVTDPNGNVMDRQIVAKNSDPWRQFLNVCPKCGHIEQVNIESGLCISCI